MDIEKTFKVTLPREQIVRLVFDELERNGVDVEKTSKEYGGMEERFILNDTYEPTEVVCMVITFGKER